MATLGTLEYLISVDSSKLNSGIASAEKSVKGFGDRLSSWAVAKGQMIERFAERAISSIGRIAKGVIRDSMDFDKSMSQVAATMGKTVAEIEELSKFARKMGSETAFSAQEAAEGLNYMALAGYDAEKAMRMLPLVLNLAAAGNMELASASDMVTDAESALGLTTEEVVVMIDQMAKTASKSNTSVSQLGDAILTVGGTAKQLAGGTKELNAVLGVLADNGIKGSEGGTMLRNVLMRLTAPTDQAARSLKELGVRAFDDQGNLRDLAEIFMEFNAAMEGKTMQERSELFSEIFNVRDLKAVEALLGTSADRWHELYREIDDSKGAAQEMADTQLDNLDGDVKLFNSALNEAKLTLMEGLTPYLREFVQHGTTLVGELTDAFKEGGLAGAIAKAQEIFDRFVTKLQSSDSPMLKLVGDVLAGIRDVLNWIIEHQNEVVTAIKAIAAAILLIKVNSAVSSLTGLFKEGGIFNWVGRALGLGGSKAVATAGSDLAVSGGSAAAAGGGATAAAAGGSSAVVGTDALIAEAANASTVVGKNALLSSASEVGAYGLFSLPYIASALAAAWGISDIINAPREQEERNRRAEHRWNIAQAEYSFADRRGAIDGATQELFDAMFADLSGKNTNPLGSMVDRFSSWWFDDNVDPMMDKLADILDGENESLWDEFLSVMQDYHYGADVAPERASKIINAIQDAIQEHINSLTVDVEPELSESAQMYLQNQLNKLKLIAPIEGEITNSGALGWKSASLSGVGQIQKHAKGAWSIPWDDYPALLHRGERVLTASQARQYSEGGNINYATIGTMIGDAVKEAMSKVYVMMSGEKVGDLTTKQVRNNINATSYSRLRALGG